MSINTMNRPVVSIPWTWRVATTAGYILIPDCTIGEAVRKAGLAGPESITPATAEEHARMTQGASVGQSATV